MFISAPACSLRAVQSKRYRNGTNGASPSLISQEHLVRKAASLCYLLSNEFTISLVSHCIKLFTFFFFPLFFLVLKRELMLFFKCLDSDMLVVSAV